ncbi:MAG: hypothetical protein ACJAW2_000358 [Shewanella sp.]|jgi:hypothetical protein
MRLVLGVFLYFNIMILVIPHNAYPSVD